MIKMIFFSILFFLNLSYGAPVEIVWHDRGVVIPSGGHVVRALVADDYNTELELHPIVVEKIRFDGIASKSFKKTLVYLDKPSDLRPDLTPKEIFELPGGGYLLHIEVLQTGYRFENFLVRIGKDGGVVESFGDKGYLRLGYNSVVIMVKSLENGNLIIVHRPNVYPLHSFAVFLDSQGKKITEIATKGVLNLGKISNSVITKPWVTPVNDGFWVHMRPPQIDSGVQVVKFSDLGVHDENVGLKPFYGQFTENECAYSDAKQIETGVTMVLLSCTLQNKLSMLKIDSHGKLLSHTPILAADGRQLSQGPKGENDARPRSLQSGHFLKRDDGYVLFLPFYNKDFDTKPQVEWRYVILSDDLKVRSSVVATETHGDVSSSGEKYWYRRLMLFESNKKIVGRLSCPPLRNCRSQLHKLILNN